MWCVIVWWSDRSGIVVIMGPWRLREDAVTAVEGLQPFSDGKIFEIHQLSAVIVPVTVSPEV